MTKNVSTNISQVMCRWMEFARHVNFLHATKEEMRCELQFVELAEAYRTPERFYHTLHGHIGFCIEELHKLFSGNIPLAVEGALWFHDAKRSEDESADMARRMLTSMHASCELIDYVCSLIDVTKHKALPHVMLFGEDGAKRPYDYALDAQAGITADIDLAIFGANEEAFDNYEFLVAREYAHVDESVRRHIRAEILERFLARDFIYNHRVFRERYEVSARKNLARSIAKLRA